MYKIGVWVSSIRNNFTLLVSGGLFLSMLGTDATPVVASPLDTKNNLQSEHVFKRLAITKDKLYSAMHAGPAATNKFLLSLDKQVLDEFLEVYGDLFAEMAAGLPEKVGGAEITKLLLESTAALGKPSLLSLDKMTEVAAANQHFKTVEAIKGHAERYELTLNITRAIKVVMSSLDEGEITEPARQAITALEAIKKKNEKQPDSELFSLTAQNMREIADNLLATLHKEDFPGFLVLWKKDVLTLPKEQQAKIIESILPTAGASGNGDVFRAVIDTAQSVGEKYALSLLEHNGITKQPGDELFLNLVEACQKGHLDIVNVILEQFNQYPEKLEDALVGHYKTFGPIELALLGDHLDVAKTLDEALQKLDRDQRNIPPKYEHASLMAAAKLLNLRFLQTKLQTIFEEKGPDGLREVIRAGNFALEDAIAKAQPSYNQRINDGAYDKKTFKEYEKTILNPLKGQALEIVDYYAQMAGRPNLQQNNELALKVR